MQITPEFGGYGTPEYVVLILFDCFAEFATSDKEWAAAVDLQRNLTHFTA